MLYELKRSDGHVVTWSGADGIDAARRYVDSVFTAGGITSVVAWREASPRVAVLGSDRIIP